MKLSNEKPSRARPAPRLSCFYFPNHIFILFFFLLFFNFFFFFPVWWLITSLAPFLCFCFLFHHKKIFHIIEIHNHCESSYEYRKMFGGIFHQCFMIIKMVHPQSFSQHIASTRHSQDVIRNFIQNRRRFFLILQDWEMWKYEKNSVNKMELFMKK